jgi:tetratricopeptide (TPR) repeat protein
MGVSQNEIAETFRQAEQALEAQRYGEALNAYRRCLELRLVANLAAATTAGTLLGAGFVVGDAVVVERLADLSLALGETRAADALLQGLDSLLDRAGNTLGSLHANLKRLELALATARDDVARACLQRIELWTGPLGDIEITTVGLERWERTMPILAGAGSPARRDREALLVGFYKALGEYLSASGQFRDAATLLQRGLVHAESASGDLALQFRVPLQIELGVALMSLGDTGTSAKLLSDVDETNSGRVDPMLRLQRLEFEARLAAMTGHYGRALSRLEAYRAVAAEYGLVRAEMQAAINYAHLLMLVNYTVAAGAVLESARARASALGETAAVVRAEALLVLTRARGRSFADGVPLAQSVTEMQHRRGRASASRPEGETSATRIDLIPPGTRYLARFEDGALSLQWVLSTGDVRQARAMLAEMRRRFGSSDSPLLKTRLDALDATIGYYDGAFARAALQLDTVIEALRAMQLLPELWQALRIKGWCLTRLGHGGVTAAQVHDEADELLATIAESLRPVDRPVFLLNKWSQQEEALASEVAELVRLKGRAETSFVPLRWLRRLGVMRRLDRLMASVDRYKSFMARQALSHEVDIPVADSFTRRFGFLRRLLFVPRHEATIAFLVLPDRVLTVVQRRGCSEFGVAVVSRLALREIVRRWHVALGYESAVRDLGSLPGPLREPKQEGLGAIATELTCALELDRALTDLPAAVTTVRFVPDDILHGFPFAALPLGDRHLVERFAVRVDHEVGGDGRRAKRSRPLAALVAAVSRGAAHVPPLPNAAVELSKVGTLLSKVVPRVTAMDSDATDRKALLSALAASDLAHIASHGIFEPSAPDLSGLVLVPRPGQVEVLNLRDLLALDLRHLQLATLSSCWSADNFVLPGRRVISLPETMLRAGAGAVIASLWPIADEVALPLMTRFYELLPTMGVGDALRQVQLDMIAGRLPDCTLSEQSAVRHWAGMTLFGSGDRIYF